MKAIFIYLICGIFGSFLLQNTSWHKKKNQVAKDEMGWLGDYKEWESIPFYSYDGNPETNRVYCHILRTRKGKKRYGLNTGTRIDTLDAWGKTGIYIGERTDEWTDIAYTIEKKRDGSFDQELVLSYAEDSEWSFPDTDQRYTIRDFEIDGKEFKECMIVDINYTDTIEPILDWYIDKLVWAKGNGLIYYHRKNGNEYHFKPNRRSGWSYKYNFH